MMFFTPLSSSTSQLEMLSCALRVSIPRYSLSQHRVEATGTLNYYSWFVLLCCSFAPDLGGSADSACLKKAPPKPCHLLRHQPASAWGQHQGILQTSDSVRILNKSLKCVPLLREGFHARRATREQGIQGKDRKNENAQAWRDNSTAYDA